MGLVVMAPIKIGDPSSMMISWHSLVFIGLPVLVLVLTMAVLLFSFAREERSEVVRHFRNVR
jgi:hypothetical protein